MVLFPDPAQNAAGATGCAVIDGVGFTVTEAVVVEVHPFAVAVIVNVMLCAVVAVLVNVPVIEDPVPLFIPVIFALTLLVHEKLVPTMLLGLVISIGVIDSPLQIICVVGVANTVGESFTVKA
jgi:hypothetical protein